jgi:hypothetical protein
VKSWLVVAIVVSGVAATVGIGYALWSHDSVPECGDGFDKAEWSRHRTGTGRAIAECDWLDGEPIASVRRALGEPEFAAHRGWYTWEIGDSRASLGPASWFLLLRVSDGVVIKSRAEVRPT